MITRLSPRDQHCVTASQPLVRIQPAALRCHARSERSHHSAAWSATTAAVGSCLLAAKTWQKKAHTALRAGVAEQRRSHPHSQAIGAEQPTETRSTLLADHGGGRRR